MPNNFNSGRPTDSSVAAAKFSLVPNQEYKYEIPFLKVVNRFDGIVASPFVGKGSEFTKSVAPLIEELRNGSDYLYNEVYMHGFRTALPFIKAVRNTDPKALEIPKIGLTADFIEHKLTDNDLTASCILHDIGKSDTGMQELLQSKDVLSAAQMKEIKKHPKSGYMQALKFFVENKVMENYPVRCMLSLMFILYHHVYYNNAIDGIELDGDVLPEIVSAFVQEKSYPKLKLGNDIKPPFLIRLFQVFEAGEAIYYPRRYHPVMRTGQDLRKIMEQDQHQTIMDKKTNKTFLLPPKYDEDAVKIFTQMIPEAVAYWNRHKSPTNRPLSGFEYEIRKNAGCASRMAKRCR